MTALLQGRRVTAGADKQRQPLATDPSRLGASHPRGPPLLAGCPMSSSRVEHGAQDMMWEEEEGDAKESAARRRGQKPGFLVHSPTRLSKCSSFNRKACDVPRHHLFLLNEGVPVRAQGSWRGGEGVDKQTLHFPVTLLPSPFKWQSDRGEVRGRKRVRVSVRVRVG